MQELQDEKSDWDHTQEKIKLLQKLDPDYPVPLEIFDSSTRLIKQGDSYIQCTYIIHMQYNKHVRQIDAHTEYTHAYIYDCTMHTCHIICL